MRQKVLWIRLRSSEGISQACKKSPIYYSVYLFYIIFNDFIFFYNVCEVRSELITHPKYVYVGVRFVDS